MKKINEKVFFLYNLLVVYIALKNIVFLPISQKVFTYYINPVLLLFMFLYCLIFLKNKYGRYKFLNDKIQIVIVIMLVYLILYFSTGLIIGYQRSPFSHDLISIIKNIYSILFVNILIEYLKYMIVKNSLKKTSSYIIIVLLFTVLEMNFMQFIQSIVDFSTCFKYISSILFPLVAKNILIIYLIKQGGILSSLSYVVPLILIDILLPIFPNFNWLMTGIVGCLLPFSIYLAIDKFVNKRDNRRVVYKRQKKFINGIPMLLVLIISIIFFRGYFNYRPISVMSNSMKPSFSRGDVVIVERVNDKNIDKIEIGDVIVYKKDEIEVIHRVIDIKMLDGEICYQLKGDNNNGPDSDLVYKNQIVGIKKYSIKYLGYPSVIISSIISNKKVDIETGK